MEEILNTGNAPLGQKEFTFPANVKQMGNIDRKFKIYIEDYVYTYIYQYAKTGGSREKLMVLVGKHTYVNDCDILIISGALQGKYASAENGIQTFTDESWLYINEQMRKFFDGESILGWCHIQPEFGIFMMARDENFHKRCFKNSYQVFCTIDPIERQECFYTYNDDKSALRPVKGYFIYYDKNESMQEYMLENNISEPKEPEDSNDFERDIESEKCENIIDRIDAADRIRRVLNTKEEKKKKSVYGRKIVFAAIGGAVCAAFIFVCVGIVQNMEKIQNLERELNDVKYTYSTIDKQIEDTASQVFAVKNEQEREKTEEQGKQEEKSISENIGIYTVEYGDTLWGICRKHYGSADMINSVMEINAIENMDTLYVGEKIVLPEKK